MTTKLFVVLCFFFFFNDTATTEIYTLSLHDALPISAPRCRRRRGRPCEGRAGARRSEEHTSELQSRQYLVCRLLLEKKKTNRKCCRQKYTTNYIKEFTTRKLTT